MPKGTDRIRNHHRQLISDLTRQVAAIATDQENADPDGFIKYLNADLIPHAVGEESGLYPRVDSLVGKYGRASATMCVDHEFIKSYANRIEEASAALKRAAPAERPGRMNELRTLVLQFEAIVKLHMEKEERVYLPLIDRYLSEHEQEEMIEAIHSGAHAQEGNAAADAKASGEKVLDVREVPPRQRHPLIFNTFESLKRDQSFVLVNDHDPKPLFYEFRAERPDQFSWDPLETGPEVWRIRITKRA